MEHAAGGGHCLNCSSPMLESDNYCSSCGQKRIGPHDHSVWHLILESAGDFFHLDSKFFATISPLLFRPGKLTVEFLAGRQAKYFHPFKMFLFLSFLYFLTTGILNHGNNGESQDLDLPANAIRDTVQAQPKKGTYNLRLEDAYARGINISDDSLRKMVRKYGLNRFIRIKYPDAPIFQRYLIKKVIKNRLEQKNDLDESMGKILPKLVFVLIPFFAFLLWLLYRKQRLAYFNHVVFSLHFLSIFFLLFWFKELLGLITRWFNPVIVLLLLAYLFLALHRVYRQKMWTTICKYLLFLLGSGIALLIFIFIAASISFMMI